MKEALKAVIVSALISQVKRLIAKHKPLVIGITGSYGKTTTKMAVATVLSSKYRVLYREGNYNTEIGLPLSIFEQSTPKKISDVMSWSKILLKNELIIAGTFPYDVIVLEMGADHPGDIEHFMTYITPDIGIVTAVAAVHTEGFGGVENILIEKWKLAQNSKTAIVNIDNKLLKTKLKQSDLVDTITYGLTEGDYHSGDIAFNSQTRKTKMGVHTQHNGLLQLNSELLGPHSFYSVLAAVAVSFKLGLTPAQIQNGISKIMFTPGRMQLLSGKNNSLIIDDTYNANADSMIAALQVLQTMPAKRRIAILGSINELGDLAESEHVRVAQKIKDIDLLVTIGADARDFIATTVSNLAGLKSEAILSFDNPVDAGNYVGSILCEGDLVLVKGSQNGVFAEEAVKLLIAKADDVKRLVRQSPSWINEKKHQFSANIE